MAYVDLNPVRAVMAADVLESDYTSIQQRVYDYAFAHSPEQPSSEQPKLKLQPQSPLNTKSDPAQKALNKKLRPRIDKQQKIKRSLQLHKLPEAPLMPFDGSSHTDVHQALPFTREDYFDLVDCTGRIIRNDKRGAISSKANSLLSQLGIDPNKWIDHVVGFGRRYAKCAGSAKSMGRYAEHFECRWGKGVGFSRQVYKKCA